MRNVERSLGDKCPIVKAIVKGIFMDVAAVKLGILGHVAKDIPTVEEFVALGDALTAIYKVLGADAAKIHSAAVAKNVVAEACSNLVEAHKVQVAAEQAKK